ncbi:hypothetical protein GCM10009641_58560 [Mycobacterium cookii]
MPWATAPTATCAWCRGPSVDLFRLVLVVLVTTGVVVAVLLFEKRRAEGIRRDTRRMAEGRDEDDSRDG